MIVSEILHFYRCNMAKHYLNRKSIEELLSVPIPSGYEYDTDTDIEKEVTEPTQNAELFVEDAEMMSMSLNCMSVAQ